MRSLASLSAVVGVGVVALGCPLPRTAGGLRTAIEQGETAQIAAIVAAGISPNHIYEVDTTSSLRWLANAFGWTKGGRRTDRWPALLLAVHAGRLAAARALLHVGAAVDGRAQSSITPLFVAAQLGYLDIVKLLLRAKANPDLATTDGETALHGACYGGYSGVIGALLTAHASTEGRGIMRRTPLHVAVRHDRLGAVRLLIAAGADRGAKDSYDNTPLCIAVRGHPKSIGLLLPAHVDDVCQHGMTALSHAADRRQPKIVHQLLASQANPKRASPVSRKTPLHYAADRGCPRCVKLLLAAGAEVGGVTRDGTSPLYLAVRQLLLIRWLLRQGQDDELTDLGTSDQIKTKEKRSRYKKIVALLFSKKPDRRAERERAKRYGETDVAAFLRAQGK